MRLTASAKQLPKKIVIQPVPLPAPVSGWDAISPLANMPSDRAVQLDNWVCRPGWIEPRTGYVPQATGLGAPVQTLMAYNGIDGTRKLFGVAGTTIWDCSTTDVPAVATTVTNLQSPRCQYVMFANPAISENLIVVNGLDSPWQFNGVSWSQPTINIGNASGSVVWSQNMVPGETAVFNGTTVTFVTGTPTGNEVQIGSSLAITLASLLTFLEASVDPNITQMTYSTSFNTTLNIVAVATGTAGNDLTLSAGYATGSITFSANPSAASTITLDGTIITFVASGATGNEVNISSTLALTLASLLSFLQSSSDSGIEEFTFTINGDVLELTAAIPGVLGNALPILASAATASGPTLTGGSTAAASGTTLSGGGDNYGITPNQFIQVNSYMSRLWFVPNNSTDVVYLQTVGGISGAASVFPLGQFLRKGGYIMAIGTWTVDTRQNVDEYIAFISSRGEIIVYQGTDPTTATTFALTGIYQVGAPIGRRCFLRITGDLQLITVDGLIGMSEMLSTDRAAANRVSLTSIIMNQMNLAAQQYKNNFGWQVIEYPLGTLVILNIPIQENTFQMQFVMNTLTGAWSRFIGTTPGGLQNASYGINSNCWEVDAFDNIYFGGNDGNVYQWNVGSGDNGKPITCIVETAYNSFGSGAQLKRYTMLQPLITTTGVPIPSIGVNVDFNNTSILSTAQPVTMNVPQWNLVNWDQFNWPGGPVTTDSWTSVQGVGHYVSIVLQLSTTPSATYSTYVTPIQVNGFNIVAESGAFV